MAEEWVIFKKPKTLYRFLPKIKAGMLLRVQGIKIQIEKQKGSIMTKDAGSVGEILVGHINTSGGYCDDCNIHEFQVLAYRQVWNPEIPGDFS